jgi:hypothetical protein
MRPITMLAGSIGMWAVISLASIYAVELVADATEAVAMWRAMPAEQIALGRQP